MNSDSEVLIFKYKIIWKEIKWLKLLSLKMTYYKKKKKTEFDILTFTQHRESGTADREIKPLQF